MKPISKNELQVKRYKKSSKYGFYEKLFNRDKAKDGNTIRIKRAKETFNMVNRYEPF